MRFYVCQDNTGTAFDCTTRYSEAVTVVRAAGGGKVVTVDAKVNADTICRLLGQIGGYAQRVTEMTVRS